MNTPSSRRRMCGVVVVMCEGQEVVHLDFLHSTEWFFSLFSRHGLWQHKRKNNISGALDRNIPSCKNKNCKETSSKQEHSMVQEEGIERGKKNSKSLLIVAFNVGCESVRAREIA
jgi:hypothetical protein